ncbi:MAG: type IV toxin-antitoxin system AbiEi family antitoxin domain-containing protein [Streptosporangiaceae bacterium]|nr:type IV toxin-antitoxin system AbiEi family antitoxin domain-containing protein [Streptosporangiaceae bacterium]
MTQTAQLDTERLRRVLAAQRDVISSSQASACGLTGKALAHRLRHEGPWQRLLPGVYSAATGGVTAEQREMAALLYAGPRSVLTGPVAVRRHGLRSPGPNTVDVLVPLTVRRQSAGFVHLHRTARLPERFAVAGRVRFAYPPRAVADAARSFTRFGDVRAVVCEAVQRRACTVQQLIDELTAGPIPGSALLRAALAEVGDGVRSVAEADLRRLILRSGLPTPMFNAQLFDARGMFIAMVDAWWQRAAVAAEVDSRAYHFTAEDQDATANRHDELAAHGILPLHFAPKLIRTSGPEVVSKLRRAIEQGLARPPLPIAAYPLAG